MNNQIPPVSVIVPAAGQGTRMHSNESKLLMLLDGKPLISYSLRVFEAVSAIEEVVLVVPAGSVSFYRDNIVGPFQLKKVKEVVEGGERRQDSVYQGLKSLSNETQVVLVHDGARPFVSPTIIEQSIVAACQFGACVVGVPCKSTIKESDDEGFVYRTPERHHMWEIQTPQAFQTTLLRESFDQAREKGLEVTDEGMLVEALGKSVKIVEGDYQNMKVTTKEDLLLAELILKEKRNR